MAFRPRFPQVAVVSEPGLGEGDSVPSKDNIRLIEGNLDSADYLDVRSNENENLLREKKGLSVSKTLFFVLGDVAGTGILAMPKALHDVGGYPGILLVILFGLTNGYTALILGRCWIMVQKKHPQYRGGCRYPYQAIGSQAAGTTGRVIVSICLIISLFGTGTVFLILAAENLRTFSCHTADFGLSHCYWILIVAGVLCPILWLGTPKDFWQIAVAAALATILVVILVLVQAGLDYAHMPPMSTRTGGHVQFGPFFLATGTMAFAFGGHAAFPTIQDDMERPESFGKVALWGYTVILALYLPVTLMGYAAYGDVLQSNVIENMSSGGMQYSALIFITLHIYCASTIVWNAVFQEAEELLNVPRIFGWKRAGLRTALLGLATFLAVSVPTFGVLMDLIGSSTFAILSLVCPALFYLILADRYQKEAVTNEISIDKDELGGVGMLQVAIWEKTLLILIMVFGLLAAGAGTYAGIIALVQPNAFSLPCYLTQISNICSN